MLKKTLITAFFALFCYANTPATATIEKIENGIAYAKVNNGDVQEFQSGNIILKELKDNAIIVARANFIALDGDTLKLDLYAFRDLKQSALPTPKIIPEAGDLVLSNVYFNNSLLIAPSKDDYDSVKHIYQDFSFFDSNIFAANLQTNSQLMPTRNDLREFCQTWVLGSITYVAKNSIDIYECSSLKKISSINYSVKNNASINFYSDLAQKLGEKSDYFSYFDELFQERE